MSSNTVVSFVINWQWKPGVKAYVTKNRRSRKPYSSDIRDADVQQWKTRAAAEGFLSRKDPMWASTCIIEEVVDG